jgi:hypothetical protein
MRYLIILAFFSISSCNIGSKKASNSTVICPIPDLPYLALERNKLDTTFDYQILANPIELKLPDSIIKGKVFGSSEFYVLIEPNKNIKDIEFIDCKLYRKTQVFYNYKSTQNEHRDLTLQIKNFILQNLKEIPFKQTKEASVGIHKTYCFIRFDK